MICYIDDRSVTMFGLIGFVVVVGSVLWTVYSDSATALKIRTWVKGLFNGN